jgi:type I restriction enzyme S subunit
MDNLLTGKIPIVEKIAFNEGKIYLRNDGKTKTGMILIRSGDLVLSGINATKGAIAIYPETEKIPIAATIHYSSYIVDKNKADISFLW